MWRSNKRAPQAGNTRLTLSAPLIHRAVKGYGILTLRTPLIPSPMKIGLAHIPADIYPVRPLPIGWRHFPFNPSSARATAPIGASVAQSQLPLASGTRHAPPPLLLFCCFFQRGVLSVFFSSRFRLRVLLGFSCYTDIFFSFTPLLDRLLLSFFF